MKTFIPMLEQFVGRMSFILTSSGWFLEFACFCQLMNSVELRTRSYCQGTGNDFEKTTHNTTLKLKSSPKVKP